MTAMLQREDAISSRSQALLTVKNLSVGYGQVRALSNVNLDVNKGEAVALVGANGAGKSTLFRAIVGLLKVATGTIAFSGRSIDMLAPDRRVRLGLGYSPEGRRIFPGLSVRENLEVASLEGKHQRDQLVERAFKLFPVLEQRQSTPGWQLSGGQQQMLAIGRALMGNPSLLLLDEPSLGLSPKLADEVFRQLRQISQQGTSVLLAEQNVSRSLGFCDRAYVLEVGKIVMSGPSAALRNTEAVKKAYLGG
ncbi:MAG: ABC transporter ATP-binding protein [Rhodomicrobium sp.]